MKDRKPGSSMAFRLIGSIVLLLAVFGIVVSSLGFLIFTNSIVEEYTGSTYRMADTATALVNGNHLDAYLAGEETAEYEQTRGWLDSYCRSMGVSLIYVIRVVRNDYGSFVSVFNAVNNSVDNTAYTEWECGYRRNATNKEYSAKYRALYEKESVHETIFRRSTSGNLHPHITSMVPVKNDAGEVEAILCIQRPIRRISDEATRFARENTLAEPLGQISRYSEISSLAGSIDTMEKDMVKYIDNLTTITADKERIITELNLARTIQANSIPNVFPAFPDRKDLDIFASMTPARQVGGDFYNFFFVDSDHLAMVIGDVSGKGIPAALFMMVTNILISDRTMMGGTPGEILTFVNQSICEHNKAEMFVTVWLGILEVSTGKLTASNAGHEYPALLRAGGCFELLKDKHGFVVGGMDGIVYKDYELRLQPGDKLFVYTDGVPEASDADHRLFGTERMISALNTDPAASPEQILGNVRAAVDHFVKDAEQFDDLTMLCVELKNN